MAQNERSSQRPDDDISTRVVAAVADARDVDPLELPPLFDVVDPDALDKLFSSPSADSRAGPGRVIFTLAGCEVVVHSDGEVAVTAPSGQVSSCSAVAPALERDKADTDA